MPLLRSAFAALSESLDRRAIARAVRAHDGDHGVGACEKLPTAASARPWSPRTHRF
jgi:hypothetical protein